jgi:hypothetical protein
VRRVQDARDPPQAAAATRYAMSVFEDMDVDELSPSTRAAIERNVQNILARSTLAAAHMTMDSDVILVGATVDGSEERVHASSAVLTETSSGFRGILEQCTHRELRLFRPGPPPQPLHPVAAVRFVLSVVHAVAAHSEHSVTGLPVSAFDKIPPLDILLSACQIADCWDCMPVLSTVAHCVPVAASAPAAVEPEEAGGFRATKATTAALVKMLRLVPSDDNPGAHWLALRSSLESTIAQRVSLSWLPYSLQGFELEAAARVINQIEDRRIELTPLTFHGATALWRSSEVGRAIKRGGEGRASRRCKLSLEVSVSGPDKEKMEKMRDIQRMIREVNAETNADVEEMLTAAENALTAASEKSVAVYLRSQGASVLLDGETRVRLVPDGISKMETGTTQIAEPVEQAFNTYVLHAGTSWGCDSLAPLKRLGGFRAECTAVISRLQLQFEVLAAWQDLTGRERIPSTSRVVGVLRRLQFDSGTVETRVRVMLGTTHYSIDHYKEKRIGVVLVPRSVPSNDAETPEATPAAETVRATNASQPAAAQLVESMTTYMMHRLDDSNGPVNRATALLDKATMRRVLQQRSFLESGPSDERDLLHMAVQWSRFSWRLPQDINEVMGDIFFAGVPTMTLMHLDKGSGWDKRMMAHTHTLRDGLIELTYGCGAPLTAGVIQYEGFEREPFELKVGNMIEVALDAQRKESHLDQTPLMYRPCFGDPPRFPSGEELNEMMLAAAMGTADLRRQAVKLQKEANERNRTAITSSRPGDEEEADSNPKGRKRRRIVSPWDAVDETGKISDTGKLMFLQLDERGPRAGGRY